MPPNKDARAKLIDAAITMVRTRGYTATSVDDLCRAAGVSKGAFFHHFRSKEELALAAAEQWSAYADAIFSEAPFRRLDDPLARILGYVEMRKAMIDGPVPEFTCFAGTTVQETFDTHPAIRDACAAAITGHAATLEADFEALIARHGAPAGHDARSFALYTQAVLQGAFILAKALNDPAVARDSLDHLRLYLESLFQPQKRETAP
jgi:TetR/AcrR family transcriptional repressor of nem operon